MYVYKKKLFNIIYIGTSRLRKKLFTITNIDINDEDHKVNLLLNSSSIKRFIYLYLYNVHTVLVKIYEVV